MIEKIIFIAFVIAGVHSHAISEQSLIKHVKPHDPKRIDSDDHHYGNLHHIGNDKPMHHEEYASSFPAYEFSYKVDDPHTGDRKSHHETRHGDVVKGVYSLVEPDGRVRTVKYYADDHTGFNAIVDYSAPHHHVKLAYVHPDLKNKLDPGKHRFYFNHIHEEHKEDEKHEHKEEEKIEEVPFMIYKYGIPEFEIEKSESEQLREKENHEKKYEEPMREDGHGKWKYIAEYPKATWQEQRHDKKENWHYDVHHKQKKLEIKPVHEESFVKFEEDTENMVEKEHHHEHVLTHDHHGSYDLHLRKPDEPERIKNLELSRVQHKVRYYGPGRQNFYLENNKHFDVPKLLADKHESHEDDHEDHHHVYRAPKYGERY